MFKNLFPSVSVETKTEKIEKVGNIVEINKEKAKEIFNFLKENVEIFCSPADPPEYSSICKALVAIYSKKQYMTVFQGLFDERFFRCLFLAAFSCHCFDQLWYNAYYMLNYIVHNCPWAIHFISENGFESAAKDCLINQKLPIRPDIIATFIIELIRIDYDSFTAIFDQSFFNFLIEKLENGKCFSDKIWVLECLLGIFSVQWYDRGDPIKDTVAVLKKQIEKADEVDYIIELCLSCFASLLISNIDPTLKALCFDDDLIQASFIIFDLDCATSCISVLNFFNNAVCFDNSSLDKLIESKSLERLIQIFKSYQGSISNQIKQTFVHFINTCLGAGKEYFEVIKSFEAIEFVIRGFNEAKQSMREEILLFICYFIKYSNGSEYDALFAVFPLEDISDALLDSNDVVTGRILIALINLTDEIIKAPNNYESIIEGISSPEMKDCIDDILCVKEGPVRECAQILNDRIASILDNE